MSTTSPRGFWRGASAAASSASAPRRAACGALASPSSVASGVAAWLQPAVFRRPGRLRLRPVGAPSGGRAAFGRRPRPRGAFAAASRRPCPPASLRGRLRRLRRGAVAERQHDLADLDLVALLDLDLLHRAADARRHFDGRLVGLELEDRLILLDGVAALTSTRTTSPAETFSPSSGILNSVGMYVRQLISCRVVRSSTQHEHSTPKRSLRLLEIGGGCVAFKPSPALLLRIDLEVLDRLGDHLAIELPGVRQLGERRERDEPRVDLEVLAQRLRDPRCGRSRRCRASASGAASTDRSNRAAPSGNRTPRRTRPGAFSKHCVTYGSRGSSSGCSMFQRSQAWPSRYSSW